MSADLMQEMATRQVVLLGETHTIAEIHRWQLHVATVLRFIRPDMSRSVSRCFRGACSPCSTNGWRANSAARHSSKRSIGRPTGATTRSSILPLFHFCRQQRVPMLALNCNRPLVTRVGKEGWDAIPEDERDGLTPSAEATVAYREYLFGLGLNRSPTGPTSAMDPKLDRFIRAQQTWDRAFACNIARALRSARSAIGDRHHRPGPSRIRPRYALSTARSRYSGAGRVASRDGPSARGDPDRRHRGCDLSSGRA